MILGLFTELLTQGGLQRVGRHTVVTLAGVARELGVPCRMLSLNDPLGTHEVRVGELAAAVEGCARSKARMGTAVMNAAPRVTRAYLGHPGLAPLVLPLKVLAPRARAWVHVHGVEIWEPLPAPHRLALRLCTAIVSISEYTAVRAREAQGLGAATFHVVPNALDPELTSGDATPGRVLPGAPGRTLLTVARLAANERYKGVDTIIRALPAVRRALGGTGDAGDVSYVVVGDGDDRPRLEALVAERGLRGQVHFRGRAPEPELRAAYRDCDVFAMPSRGEGFGVAFLEAMAFAKPCLAADSGGAPEVVVDGETGFLIPYDDDDAAADRLTRLLSDAALRERMGEAGRRRVGERFTFEHFRRRLAAIVA